MGEIGFLVVVGNVVGNGDLRLIVGLSVERRVLYVGEVLFRDFGCEMSGRLSLW